MMRTSLWVALHSRFHADCGACSPTEGQPGNADVAIVSGLPRELPFTQRHGTAYPAEVPIEWRLHSNLPVLAT